MKKELVHHERKGFFSFSWVTSLRMRVTALFLLISLSGTFASVYSQRVTLNLKNVSLEEALEKLSRQSGVEIAYSSEVIKSSRKVTVRHRDAEMETVLNDLLKGTRIRHQLIDGKVYLSAVKEQQPAQQSRTKEVEVKGIIVDTKGEAIVGANVFVTETMTGVSTGMDGKFAVMAPEGAKLRISFIGYITQEIVAQASPELKIVLKEDAQNLDEVVVIGYGTTKKRDLTGAVSSVKMDDTPLATVSSVSQALAGKAAGFQVSMLSAQPGGGASFLVRGSASSDAAGNDPLIIIDGFPVSDPGNVSAGKYQDGTKDNILSSINPNDIESIEILKDASATAIYGSRAGNGVVIITTKRGKAGALRVQYSGSASLQKMAKGYDMMNAREFMHETNRYLREKWMYDNKIGVYGGVSEGSVAPFTPRYDETLAPENDTDWFDLITRTGWQTQHNVSLNGGSEKTQYLVSLNYFKQEGVVKNNGMERYSARVNLDQKISDYVKAGINLTMSRNNYDNVPLGSGQNENAPILVSAAQFNPLLSVKDANGDYVLNTMAAFLPNPVSLLEITDQTRKERMLATVFVEIEPIKDLRIRGNVGIDRNYQKRQTYLPRTTLYGQKEGGKADIAQADNSDYLAELTVSYNKTIKDHTFGIMAGHSYQVFEYESLGLSNNKFLIDGFLFNNIGAGAAEKPGVASSAGKDRMASFFGRLNYSYLGRYLLTATLRADGSSNFSKNNRWGYFPSVALGWRISDENFMQGLSHIVSNTKLRVSYGETGNANVGNKAISFYQVGYNNVIGNSEVTGVYLSQFGNPDLKWETTKEWNFGLDLGFFNNRINVTAEYFNRVVSDLLNEKSLLNYHEVDKIIANIGETQSRGFELTINTRNIETTDFSWSTDITLSAYRDKWKQRDPDWKPAAYSIYHAPMRGWYGYRADGLVKPGEVVPHMPAAIPGQVKLKDIDGFQRDADGNIMVDSKGRQIKTGKPDGRLDDADKEFWGSSDPGYLFGFNNTLRFKNWDLNFYMYGQFDKLVNGRNYQKSWLTGADGMTGVVNMNRGYNMPRSVKDIWSHDNPNGTMPGYFQSESQYGIGDYFLEKTWFLRMRNITLGYTVPAEKMRGVLSALRVYVDVNNPFVITPYDGLDPETDNSSWAYPNVRTYSLGVDITF